MRLRSLSHLRGLEANAKRLYCPCSTSPAKLFQVSLFCGGEGERKGEKQLQTSKRVRLRERERERAREKEREELTGVALHCVSSMGLALENSFPAQLA